MTHQEISAYLHSLANQEHAQHAMRYFKTAEGEYGHGDIFLGIRVPLLRQAVKKYQAATIITAKKILQSEYHEIRLIALLLLVAHFEHGDAAVQDKIYHLHLNNTRFINNWDLVDSSAPQIVGAYLQGKDKHILYELAASQSLWQRRIAVLATFTFIRNYQFADALHIAALLLNDSEDLIHKAVGWMLREIGKRELAVEAAFLKKHCQHMPRTMLRYSIEKFSPAERKKYLSGKV